MKKFLVFIVCSIIYFLLINSNLSAAVLPFGLNKVTYRQFEWKILETTHFYIYFYPEEESIAKSTALIAEEAYALVTRDLGVTLPEKTPLFLYRNQIEFQQTNIISGYLGDGTGGVTEALKNRIVIPIVSSERRLKEVIIHEFTHRVQFEVLYGGFGKSVRLLRSIFVPLWFMEGMAEYEAPDEDPTYTEMMIRDAVISERLRSISNMESFNHVEGREIVLMYKLSQKIFEYAANFYGKEKVGKLLKEYIKPQISVDSVFENILGIKIDEFNKKWLFALKEQYWGEIQGRKNAEDYGKPVVISDKDEMTLNTNPAWSSKGDKIAYISDGPNYTDIYILDLKTLQKRSLLGYSFEYVVRSGSGLSWSYDGTRIVFCATSGDKSRVFTYNIDNGEIKKVSDGFEFVKSPSFSKNGDIVFIGGRNSVSNLYISKADGRIIQLTDDIFDDDYPSFSPDGEKIAYVSEREGHRNIYIIDVNGNHEITALTSGEYEDISPCWSPDGSKIIFSSNRYDNRYNLFEVSLQTKEFICLTYTKIGLFTPRYSPDGKKVVFSSYENGCQNIYIMDLIIAYSNGGTLKKFTFADFEKKNAQNAKEADINDEIKKNKYSAYNYSFKPDLDLLYFIFGYDSSAGFLGGAYLAGSDMLGDHSFELYGDYIKDYHLGYQLSYFFLPWRVNLGASIFRWRTYYSTLDSNGSTLTKYWVEDFGASLIARYPLDRFYRVDLGVTTEISSSEGTFGNVDPYKKQINAISLALVREKRNFNIDEAINGSANNFTIEYSHKWLGSDVNSANIFTEHQVYAGFTREIILAFRLFYGGSLDVDQSVFLLGGANTLRGYGFGAFMGSNTIYFNAEFRFPLIEDINFNLWPFNWLMIKKFKAAVFTDTGIVWNRDNFSLQNLKNGVGVGLRLHTFLVQSVPIIIRFDIGKRTDSSEREVYYISLGHAF